MKTSFALAESKSDAASFPKLRIFIFAIAPKPFSTHAVQIGMTGAAKAE